jgi:exodeoxyribonuclease III
MRVVVWNCSMAFHRKYQHLLALKPDIAVIPECANVETLATNAHDFQPTSSVWIGDNPRKGLAVFTFGSFRVGLSDGYRDDCPYIAPIIIEGPVAFNLLAIWACHNKKNSYQARLGPLNRAITAYRSFIQERPCLVAGDFNDNVLWDQPQRPNKHSLNVKALTDLGLTSAYHYQRGVEQGFEPEPTLYWRNRKVDGPRYHIDYCFVPDDWAKRISWVTVGEFDQWVGTGLSDHVPLVVDVKENAA